MKRVKPTFQCVNHEWIETHLSSVNQMCYETQAGNVNHCYVETYYKDVNQKWHEIQAVIVNHTIFEA